MKHMKGPDIFDLKTDDEFKNLIRPLTRQEYLQLETNIIADGCLTPIVTWKGVIVDGHNRYEICRKNGIPFFTEEHKFSCREEAIAWICANQLGRRNLSEETRKYLIGIQYESEKTVNRKKNARGTNQYSGKSEDTPDQGIQSRSKTAARIADAYHVSRGSVEKYAIYSKALKKIEKKEPALVSKILSGKYKISHNGVLELSSLPAEDVKKINRQMERADSDFVRYQSTRKEIFQNRQKEIVPDQSPSVKDMPAYDPDSEVTALSLTMPSWVSSMSRVEKATDFSRITRNARERLQSALIDLQNSALHMLTLLRENSK